MSYLDLDSKFDFGRPFFECDTHARHISVVKIVKSALLASPRFLYKNEFEDVRFFESLILMLMRNPDIHFQRNGTEHFTNKGKHRYVHVLAISFAISSRHLESHNT